jgi:hypothetical protein
MTKRSRKKLTKISQNRLELLEFNKNLQFWATIRESENLFAENRFPVENDFRHPFLLGTVHTNYITLREEGLYAIALEGKVLDDSGVTRRLREKRGADFLEHDGLSG